MQNTLKGRIIKAISGFFYVDSDGLVYECRARNFRRAGIKPVVGDIAEFQVLDEDKKLGNLVDIEDRKNVLVRPAVANVDQALVVFQVADPRPNLYLLDRFLVMMSYSNVPVVIVFSKSDLVSDEEVEGLAAIYSGEYRVILTSVRDGRGIDEVRALLEDGLTTIAGPSGAGKSSLINELQSQVLMETGEISKKLQHGRNTTRHSQLIAVGSGYIIDTPGFSTMFLPELKSGELEQHFPEMTGPSGKCRFIGCSHKAEPDCGVKVAVREGRIAESRYESYVRMYDELKDIENTY